jgi:hypothetical protein
MGIFTSQRKNLQDLPEPASFEFGSVRGIELPEIKKEISSVPEQEEMKAKKQIFVKMENYKEALDTINKVRDKIKDADMVLNELRSMKSKEDEHLAKWHRDLEDVKDKLNKMDQILYNIEHE